MQFSGRGGDRGVYLLSYGVIHTNSKSLNRVLGGGMFGGVMGNNGDL
jgi:hypothetical protein